MLCLQQCIDLCDISPEEAQAIREHATLAEILAIQAECPHVKATMKGGAADAEAVANCDMLDIRDQLLAEVGAAEDFDDLERVVHRYCDYEDARDGDGAEAGGRAIA